MRRGRVRPLTPAEAKLWAAIARQVAPLRGKAPPAEPPEPSDPLTVAEALPPPGPAVAAPSPPRPGLKPLAPLDLKTRRGMARGRLRPDATLDLHGMRQSEAHAALRHFLLRAQASGCRLVTIVTGKGGLEDGERGVLRRMVPHWLAVPALRSVVMGWDEAAPHRGGAGALHVRLRSARGG